MTTKAREIASLKKIALFGCSIDGCREEVSYHQDMLAIDPTSGEPICETCWDEVAWEGHRDDENYEPPDWGDLEPYTPVDDALLAIEAETVKRCAGVIEEWNTAGELRLHMGELSAQELRAVQAFQNWAADSIRSLKGK